ncbi:DUF4189 domain-containing protein [Nocardia cyriacigeorgica]|uniref:DUF4189 domain-containing protein n=1 Tax=Nocardia cyriacigeorgica TaxID=135487 RepID=A0A6P1D753_9NOCA|nr:DUF4189 domain-containing protein [Nocardia cyriacigeorgica]NEW42128.1 DUF4189 domain-containing protein [Nocardia cyriacigeorgica]NEW44830.1 DUF4189 domain-containing protein [Nocardia cyriacigeorgica]NEW53066.1 DUF4189 domain-containing protein [Nocardia cyriacigeorgica]NEW57111.1 DUF4189 domain-containing protein [Nocardia cyriacigeorgica]
MSVMNKVGFSMVAFGLAAGSVLGAGSASAAGQYAAIAFSGQTVLYGVSVDEASDEAARGAALANCGQSDCQVLISWANGCGALVENKEGVAAASGANREQAEQAAFRKLAEVHPTALLANVGSADLSGAKVVEVVCTANAR